MKILIIYFSQSGNTKKVVGMVEERLKSFNHIVMIRNALTATTEHVMSNDLLLIGTPVHGYILFRQKPAKEVREFLKHQLPHDLNGKAVIGFATYLFFPAGALNPIKDAIKSKNGKIIGLFAQRRTNKTELVEEIIKTINESITV